MSFYLGVWSSPVAITDEEAAVRYAELNDGKPVRSKFHDQVYAFYCRLTALYPEVEMVPEDDLDSCPWACGMDMAGDHVIMAILPEQSAAVLPQVLALAAKDELVCFDPQSGKVHLPPHLSETKAAAAGTAGATPTEPSTPSDMLITGLFKLSNMLPEPQKP